MRTWRLGGGSWVRCGLFAAAGLLLAVAAGCTDKSPGQAQQKPPEVLVSEPVTRQVIDYEDFPGRTEAVESVDVRARVTGYLNELLFREGYEVVAGQELARIDPRSYEADLKQATADIERFKATIPQLERDLRRAESASSGGAVTSQELDKARSSLKEAQASLHSAEASRDRAQLYLGFATVTAPISGRVSKRMVTLGNLVKADDTIITNIVSLSPIYAAFDVDERTLLRLRRLVQSGRIPGAHTRPEEEVGPVAAVMGLLGAPNGPLLMASLPPQGLPIELGLLDEEGFSHKGFISFVDNQVDPQTGTLHVRAVFSNQDRLLSPGLFVRMRFPVGSPHEALLISEQSMSTDQGKKFVYVVNDAGEAVYTPVKVGALHDGLRVVEQGVKPGDRVIVTGLQRVRPGAKVTAKLVDMPTNGQSARPPLVSKSEAAPPK